MAIRHFFRTAALSTSVFVIAGLSAGASTAAPAPSDGASGANGDRVSSAAQMAAPSRITISASAKIVRWPNKVTVRGTVTDQNGNPSANASVLLWARPAGIYDYRVSSYKTDGQGRLFASRRPERKTVYFWRTPNETAKSGNRQVAVRPALTSRYSGTRIRQSTALVVTGASSPTRAGTPVLLQRKSGSTWLIVDRTRIKTASSSPTPQARYRLTFKAIKKGKRTFRVVVPADGGRARAINPRRVVTFV